MIDYLQNALDELKRADHLVYVSLKYTRTVDVLKSVIDRLILVFDQLIDGALYKLEEKGKIESIPVAPVMKAKIVKQAFNEEKIDEAISFYLYLRKLSRAKFDRAREFRRHVTMTAYLDNGETKEINIDVSHEYYDKTKEFFEYAREKVMGKE